MIITNADEAVTVTGDTNPWLDVPPADYAAHMSSPEVGQLGVLSSLMHDALQVARPERLLVLGCGIGNGFEHIDPAATRVVTGIDINAVYLAELEARLPSPAYQRFLHCADISAYSLPEQAFDLIYAALVFEYVNWRALLPRIVGALAREGCLSVVVQRPSPAAPAVSHTPYTSLRKLESLFAHVAPADVVTAAAEQGLVLESLRHHALPQQKSFAALRFRARPASS
jgi:predicted TPR repeat methyltransferase